MKATTWLFPVLTLLCATRLVCTAQRGIGGGSGFARYPLDYAVSNMMQDNYLLEKRNKPSLSIVNPLDVLRQRLLLEIARRQMKENTRQVELNRAILKNVGKRMSAIERHQMSLMQPQIPQQQEQRELLLLNQQYPMPLDYMPTASIFDAVFHRPVYDELFDDENKSLDMPTNKYQINGNEIENESNRKAEKTTAGGATAAMAGTGAGADTGTGTGTADTTNAGALGNSNRNSASNPLVRMVAEDESEDGNTNAGYQLRYLYRLHKNHPTNK